MEAPDDSVIQSIKAKFPGRSLHLVTVDDGGEEYFFIMTGSSREEYKKYLLDMQGSEKDMEKIRIAVERAALAQIRWPERDVVRELFESKPALSMHFGEQITKAAGADAEVRSKKL